MKKKYAIMAFTMIILMLVGAIPCQAYGDEKSCYVQDCCNQGAVGLKNTERKLWSDHAFYTSNFIKSDIANLEDKSKVLERLLRNQDDIGNSIKPYYGEEAGNKLAGLLREHIKIAGSIVDAAKVGNKDDLDKYNKLWFQNADQIIDFLSVANPKLEKKELKDMFYRHLQLVTDQVVARINKNWDEDIAAYDKGVEHLLKISDLISGGIVEQFPNKFK